MAFLLPAPTKVKKEPDGMVHVILVSRNLLLVHIHITKIKTQPRTDFLVHADEQTVLVESIVHNIFPELNQDLIRQHQCGRSRFGKYTEVKTGQVPYTVRKPRFPCALVILGQLYPSLLVPYTLRNAGSAHGGTNKELLVDPVFVRPGFPILPGWCNPRMSVTEGGRHIIFYPVIGTEAQEIEILVLNEVISPDMEIAQYAPFWVEPEQAVYGNPGLDLVVDFFLPTDLRAGWRQAYGKKHTHHKPKETAPSFLWHLPRLFG
jgi:hypothetical protein